MRKILPLLILVGFSFNVYSQEFNEQDVLKYVKILSHDFLEGRKTGTKGNEMARKLIEEHYKKHKLKNFNINNTYTHPFAYNNDKEGKNVLGYIPGVKNQDQFIVMSAHYDHLGKTEDGRIYHGADDNASGVGGLLAAIEYFSANPPENSILFAAFDAEELGLQGSRAFVNNPPVTLDKVLVDINMDMIGRNAQKELYACGTRYYPFLKKYIDGCCTNIEGVKLLFGHDSPAKSNPSNDWTEASDHGPFHQKKIPFIYFGVEDHEDYHKPTDEFDKIDRSFYLSSVRLVISAARAFDKNSVDIKSQRK